MNFDEMSFTYSVSELKEGVLKVEMAGSLNEDAMLIDVIDEVLQVRGSYGSLIIDLSKIASINSCGVRSWLLFLEKIQAIIPCSFSILSNSFAEQVNTVSNMIGNPPLKVFALEAPYYCAKCDNQKMYLLETSKIIANKFKAPVFTCDKCKKPMEFDSFEDEYFSFLKRTPGK